MENRHPYFPYLSNPFPLFTTVDLCNNELFRRFDPYLRELLPSKFHPWYYENLGEFKDKIKALTDQELDQILTLFKSFPIVEYVDFFRAILRAHRRPTVDAVFTALVCIAISFNQDIHPTEFRLLNQMQLPRLNLDDKVEVTRWKTGTRKSCLSVELVTLFPDVYQSRDTAITLWPLDSVHSDWSLVDDGFDYFCHLLPKALPPEFLSLFHKKYDEFEDKFKSLEDGERGRILTSLNGCPSESIEIFHRFLRAGPTQVETVFHALLMLTGIHWAIGDPEASSSSSPAASHNEPYNKLCDTIGAQPPLQRSQASHGNSPVRVGDTIIPVGGELTSGPKKILAESRAARDDKTAEHSNYYGTLVPANYTNAKQAFEILKSTYHSTKPFPIKTSGYLTVVLSCAALLLSLVGLLSAFKPNTFPSIMHNAVLHITAYAFIGTMIHEYLQDDPILMWIVAGLNIAFFNAIMWYVGRRR